MKIRTVLTALSIALAGSVFAQTSSPTMPRVDQREAKQQARIDQGVASGQLNQKEATRLENGQARVNQAEANAKADGKVTRREKHKLDHMQDKQSRHIKRQKHDQQKAG
ncbi:MAG: hypothetical protein EAZ37_06615 [Burkholderiales bacterium]|nr:MAG: hypothetical protein EAZ37_06615 [Burkholderiales bacterium]